MPALINTLLRTLPWSWRTHIKSIPGVAWLNRIVVAAALSDREFIHQLDAGPARGVTFRVRMPEDKGIWTGTYEHNFAAEVAAVVEPGCVAYDIGGWHGFFAGVMAARGAREVHVFEPVAGNAQRINSLIELNPRFDIRLHQFALGDQDTEAELLLTAQTSMAKLSKSMFQPTEVVIDRKRVRLAKIDTLIASGELAPPNLIKMDVEGAEAFVIFGALEVLRKYRPLIFAEVHSSILLSECSDLLGNVGYGISAIDNEFEGVYAAVTCFRCARLLCVTLDDQSLYRKRGPRN